MGNQISRNVISIVYFLFYVGSAPNLLARNAIVLLFFLLLWTCHCDEKQ